MTYNFQTFGPLQVKDRFKRSHMKATQSSNQVDKQKMIHHLQKATSSLLNLFNFMNVTPLMIEITNIIDYVKNLEQMLNELCKTLPKKCVPLQLFKKIQSQSLQKTQHIHKLLLTQKTLKIQLKVLQQKNQELQLKLKEKDTQIHKEHQLPDTLQRLLKSEKQRQREKQAKTNLVSERYIVQKLSLGSQKKRLSLPYISSHSIHIPSPQKSILKLGIQSGSKSKKHTFVTIPGQGRQILIQHLMNKAIHK